VLTHLPRAVPEIPVSHVEKAAEYYVNVLGFHFDWGNDEGGIGGISQGECRMFLTNAPFRQHYGSGGTIVVWLNLDSKRDQLASTFCRFSTIIDGLKTGIGWQTTGPLRHRLPFARR
jgi:hypothetical protein